MIDSIISLDHAGIAARIPHSGRMCLLDGLLDWSRQHIHCRASGQADPSHPLRGRDGLSSVNAVEYASQAMALHGALCAQGDAVPALGFLAGARAVRLFVPRLDDVSGVLHVHAWLQAGDAAQAIYRFEMQDTSGRLLVDGRTTVVLRGRSTPEAT